MLMTSRQHAAKALGGELWRGQVLCPGPGHPPHDRSLSVLFDSRAPDGFVVNSFSNKNDWRECRHHVLDLLGLRRERPVEYRQPARRKPPAPPDDVTRRATAALDIWLKAEPLRRTPAEAYLVRRGVALEHLPDAGALRWYPRCPWGNDPQSCLLALWTDVITGKPSAVHRRPISAVGEPLAHWRGLGPTTGCVIRLWPDDAVEQALVLGEGIETVLAAATRLQHRGTILQPAWAAGDAGHLAAFPVLPGIEAITILVDNDPNGTGQRAASQCAERWVDAEREVVRLTPRAADTDFADIVEGSA